MAWSIDARIPVTIAARRRRPARRAGRPAGGGAGGRRAASCGGDRHRKPSLPDARHAPACACCAGRSAAAQALDRLFQARVRGRAAWFDRVLVLAETEDGRAELAQALAQDPLTTARFRAG